MIYVIGDLHLSFSTDKPMDKFGDEWKLHHEKIEKDWREKVRDEDIVLVAGDTSWAMRYEDARVDFEWIHRLPGKKVIIKGNHDYWWNFRSRLVREFDSIFILNSNCFEHGRYAIVGTRGWDFPDGHERYIEPGYYTNTPDEDEVIFKRELVRLENSLKSAPPNRVLIAMVHYPPTFRKEENAVTKLFDSYGVKTVYYGHLHGEHGFKLAYEGELNGCSYRLISCDYTDFKLVEVPSGSDIPVDDTDFRGSADLLETRIRGIRRLEEGALDKSKFIEYNYELAKEAERAYIPVGIGDDCENREKICQSIAASQVRSIADGIIKYNYLNAIAKHWMCRASDFEFNNFEKFKSLRAKAHAVYEQKEKVTKGLCERLLESGQKIDFYKICMRSEALDDKLYEIVSLPEEKLILHTQCPGVIRFLRESGVPEGAKRVSVITNYVNRKI